MNNSHTPGADAEHTKMLQFLSDVVTAAGLLSHGKTDKGLARRIADEAYRILAATPAGADVTAQTEAAEKLAALYEDDDRQDIKTDVMNSFYKGVAFARLAAGAPAETPELGDYRTCCDHPDCPTCGGLGGFYRMAAQAAPVQPATTGMPVAVVDESDDGIFVEILPGEHGTDLKRGDCLYASQPATGADGQDAKLFKNVTGLYRIGDQSVQLVFTSCHQASVFEKTIAAMLAPANSEKPL
jgi:hypothetical protein